MLNVPPPTRAAIGTLEIAGKKVEVFVSPEWARYFLALNSQTVANASTPGGQAHLALLGESAEAPDVFPGPPGPRGGQGDPGLALFLLADTPDDSPLLVPPGSSFTTLTASAGFGCNGKSAQGSAAVNAAATDLTSVIALCNQLRAALIANGIAA